MRCEGIRNRLIQLSDMFFSSIHYTELRNRLFMIAVNFMRRIDIVIDRTLSNKVDESFLMMLVSSFINLSHIHPFIIMLRPLDTIDDPAKVFLLSLKTIILECHKQKIIVTPHRQLVIQDHIEQFIHMFEPHFRQYELIEPERQIVIYKQGQQSTSSPQANSVDSHSESERIDYNEPSSELDLFDLSFDWKRNTTLILFTFLGNLFALSLKRLRSPFWMGN